MYFLGTLITRRVLAAGGDEPGMAARCSCSPVQGATQISIAGGISVMMMALVSKAFESDVKSMNRLDLSTWRAFPSHPDLSEPVEVVQYSSNRQAGWYFEEGHVGHVNTSRVHPQPQLLLPPAQSAAVSGCHMQPPSHN